MIQCAVCSIISWPWTSSFGVLISVLWKFCSSEIQLRVAALSGCNCMKCDRSTNHSVLKTISHPFWLIQILTHRKQPFLLYLQHLEKYLIFGPMGYIYDISKISIERKNCMKWHSNRTSFLSALYYLGYVQDFTRENAAIIIS